ncbi:MAG: hypothetical protein KF852_06660 [Saprospiraceae bacterium]|nr:hypothetical protein [Saprospiraceae bacterium]
MKAFDLGAEDYITKPFDVFISMLHKLLQNDPRISIEIRVGFIFNVPE